MSSPQDGGWRFLIRVTLISIFFLSPAILLIRWQNSSSAFQNLLQKISTSISTSNVSSKSAASNNPPHSPNSSTCLSRWQQDDFFPSRKSFTPDLKSPLSTAFAEYEKMHSSCYHHHHGKQLTKAITSPDRNDPCKYLVFLQDGKFGLGNYILSLLSAFVYALLTNRMLLVDARYNLPDLFCEPFTNSSWLLPPQFPYQNLLQAPFLDDKLEEKLKYVNSVHLMLLNEQTQGQQRFFCSQTQALLDKVLWIGWSSNQYYVPRFFTFPQFWRPLTNLFPDVSTVFTQLSRRLVLPHNHVWEKILRFQSAYLSSPGKKIGIQIRMRGDRATFDVPTYQRVMQCLIGNGLLPNISESGNDLPNPTIQRQKDKTKAFVTSLQGRFYEEMKKSYTNQPTVDGSLVEVHTLSHDEVESQSYEQAVNALAEMWLLSACDDLVTSSWSTFGYVAQGLAGTRPFILNIKGEFEKDGLPPCSVGQSAEPCNQFPFSSVICNEANHETDDSTERSEWIKAHLRSCQDEPGGIQLVNP